MTSHGPQGTPNTLSGLRTQNFPVSSHQETTVQTHCTLPRNLISCPSSDGQTIFSLGERDTWSSTSLKLSPCCIEIKNGINRGEYNNNINCGTIRRRRKKKQKKKQLFCLLTSVKFLVNSGSPKDILMAKACFIFKRQKESDLCVGRERVSDTGYPK